MLDGYPKLSSIPINEWTVLTKASIEHDSHIWMFSFARICESVHD